MSLPGNKCAWQESFVAIYLQVVGEQTNVSWARLLDPHPPETDDFMF